MAIKISSHKVIYSLFLLCLDNLTHLRKDLIDKRLVSSLACFVIVLIHNYSVEGGELFDRVVSVTRFEEPTAKLLFYQMLVAVKVGKLFVASRF